MNKPKFFKYIGEYSDISKIQTDVESLSEDEWNKFDFRQKTIVGHEYTQTIPLIFDYEKKTRKILHPNYSIFEKHLADISIWLKDNQYSDDIKRANLVKLFSRSKIDKHIDQGDFLKSTNRIHFVIKTNQLCSFMIDRETKVFKEGEVWEINNTGKIHGVENNGDTDRIHLIIDVG